MKRYLIFLLIAAAVFSCKKDPKTISISGTVTDTYLNTPVSGVKVTLQANGVVEGVYNSSYLTIGTFTTDASGHFEFIIDESAYDSFRFSFLKSGYYYYQEVLSANTVTPEQPYSGDFGISSKAVVSVHVKNNSPYDNYDNLTISFSNNPVDEAGCCTATAKIFDGMLVDTAFSCSSVGGFDLQLVQSVTKNNATNYQINTIHTIPNDTVFYEILY